MARERNTRTGLTTFSEKLANLFPIERSTGRLDGVSPFEFTSHLYQKLVDELDGHGAFADGGGDAFDGAGTDVAGGEDAGGGWFRTGRAGVSAASEGIPSK